MPWLHPVCRPDLVDSQREVARLSAQAVAAVISNLIADSDDDRASQTLPVPDRQAYTAELGTKEAHDGLDT
jgi:hypothetical protein